MRLAISFPQVADGNTPALWLLPSPDSPSSPSYTFLEELFDTLKRGPTLRAPLPSIDNNHGAGLDDESDPMSSILAKTKRLEEMEIELQKAREIVLRGEADHASPESSPEEGTAPLYEIRIHPTDLKSLLEKAPTPEIRAAWTNGQVVDAKDHCRLLLVESAAAAKGAWRGVSCTSSEELFKEGTEWWERCAGI